MGGENFFIFLLNLSAARADNQNMEANLWILLATLDGVGCACYAGSLWAIPFGILCVTCAALGLVKGFRE